MTSTYPHDDARCRQDSVDAAGFREACRALAQLADAAGIPDTGMGFAEMAQVITDRLTTGELNPSQEG